MRATYLVVKIKEGYPALILSMADRWSLLVNPDTERSWLSLYNNLKLLITGNSWKLHGRKERESKKKLGRVPGSMNPVTKKKKRCVRASGRRREAQAAGLLIRLLMDHPSGERGE